MTSASWRSPLTLRVTEDAVEKPLDKVGLVRSVTKLRGYRQDILDERAGQAVAGVMVEESGAPVILVVRVKVDSEQKLSELELVATRSRADGLIFNVDAYSGAPAKPMNIVPRPAQLATREQAIEIAMHYPRAQGLGNAEDPQRGQGPFAKDAIRLENGGAQLAGPGCVRQGLRRHQQPVPIHPSERLGKVTVAGHRVSVRMSCRRDRDHAPVGRTSAAPARTSPDCLGNVPE